MLVCCFSLFTTRYHILPVTLEQAGDQITLHFRWKDNPSMAEGLVYEGVQAEPMEFSGGSAAQSSLLHCFDELLGVKHEEYSGETDPSP